jgi:hypothetical protein
MTQEAPRDSIKRMLNSQDELLLRKGQLASEKFDRIRERHIWFTYHFTSGFPGSAITALTSVFNSAEYILFSGTPGQNAAGLPAGFMLTDIDTNFLGQGRTPDQQNLLVKELGITLEPNRPDIVAASNGAMLEGAMTAYEQNLILSNMWLVIKYLSTDYQLARVSEFTQSGGPSITGGTLLDFAAAGTIIPGFLQGGQSEPTDRIASWQHNSGVGAAQPKKRRKLDVPILLPSAELFNFKLNPYRPIQMLPLPSGGKGGFRVRFDMYVTESYRDQ